MELLTLVTVIMFIWSSIIAACTQQCQRHCQRSVGLRQSTAARTLSHLGLDTHRARAELQAVKRLLRVLLRVGHRHHQRRLRIAAQRLLHVHCAVRSHEVGHAGAVTLTFLQ